MITDTEIKRQGVEILASHLGEVEMARFIALIQREPFDYTEWRQSLDDSASIEGLSRRAMASREKLPR
jgi:hypothetical protein